jgi:hypothetical protein
VLSYYEAGGTSMSSLGYHVHLEGVVGVGGQDVGRVGPKLHLVGSDGAEKVITTIAIESDTTLSEGILPRVGVLESIFHSWFIELERYARSDGYTHIRERKE